MMHWKLDLGINIALYFVLSYYVTNEWSFLTQARIKCSTMIEKRWQDGFCCTNEITALTTYVAISCTFMYISIFHVKSCIFHEITIRSLHCNFMYFSIRYKLEEIVMQLDYYTHTHMILTSSS